MVILDELLHDKNIQSDAVDKHNHNVQQLYIHGHPIFSRVNNKKIKLTNCTAGRNR